LPDLEQRYFPIWKLGYRSNPFRALTLDEWQQIAILPKDLEQLIESPPPLTQVLGEKGTGKTSTLLALQAAFQERSILASYEYIPIGKDDFATKVEDVPVLLLDEAQRLSPRSRKRLLSSITTKDSGANIFLSTHEDLRIEADDLNLPILTVDLNREDRVFVASMIECRLQFFQKRDLHGIRPSEAALTHVIEACGSDLRKLESLLYEAYQTWKHPEGISKDHIIAVLKRMGYSSGESTNVF